MEKSMKECLILGNGKSLMEVPDLMLETYPSFGVNYCLFQPNFYVCVDHDILVNHSDEIYRFARDADFAFLAEKEKGTSRLYELPRACLITNDRKDFSRERYFSGMTVTYVALKMAYYLGFETVHLWGVDFNKEWDHYKPDYPPGDIARRESLMTEMFYHLSLAARVYKAAGRRIINHSYKSKLDEIFQRG